MTENRRDKILPEDLIQRTNLQQHNFMIDAINDIDGRQGDIERITNVNIDDIVDLKTDVVALSNDKLDKADIDEDIHFGPITITKDGTAVIASFDAINPTTGTVTPLSFLLPGATTTDAGVMDASSVAWITNAEARISALEGLSDVKAIVGLNATPTQTEINNEWMDKVGKAPETGDLVQDVSNAKLWVYVTDTWLLYGTVVTVPLATTTSLGGVKDTALDAPSNRWYGHVEADGRLSLIGGDSLSTLLDTTVPGIQTGVNGKVGKTGNETIAGVKTFTDIILTQRIGENGIRFQRTEKSGKEGEITGHNVMVDLIGRDSSNRDVGYLRMGNDALHSYTLLSVRRILADDSAVDGNIIIRAYPDGSTVALGITPPANASGIEIPTAGWTISKINSGLTSKQDKLTFDSAPTAGSANPVTSGGVYTALDAKQDGFSLYEHTITVNTSSGGPLAFTLTVLNQTATPFTLSTLRDYLGSASDDYKQCTGLAWRSPYLIDLIRVRGGGVNELVLHGIKRDLVTVDYQFDVNHTISLNWGYDATNIQDKVRQMV